METFYAALKLDEDMSDAHVDLAKRVFLEQRIRFKQLMETGDLALTDGKLKESSDAAKYIIDNQLKKAGLQSVYQVQNRVLLCAVCRGEFSALRRYIDVVDGRLVAKVVNLTSDANDRDYVGPLEISLRVVHFLFVYFADDDKRKHPNHAALAFHKAACLIWTMAGGGDVTEDDEIDNEGTLMLV
ncbi:hypothetical protein HDU81_007514 [Chytriomyces hyalinus]|nr:hypothetical protein HDU81_007514 [Chytriomyces hyalinus]